MRQNPNPSGLCQCGCGSATSIATGTDAARGCVKGFPRRFLVGHNTRKAITTDYRKVHLGAGVAPKRLHILRAEAALGRPLPAMAIVHHADGSHADDAPLVICEDQAYHMLLHARMRVKQAGGNPNTDAICGRCQRPLARDQFARQKSGVFGVAGWCRACKAETQGDYKRRYFDKKRTVALQVTA